MTRNWIYRIIGASSIFALVLIAAGVDEASARGRGEGAKARSGGSHTTVTRTGPNGQTATRDAVVARDPEAGVRTKDVTWTGAEGRTANRNTVTEKTENGRTTTTTVTRPDGSTTVVEKVITREDAP
jgi:hypothetical protein